jgi:hypothetical protein
MTLQRLAAERHRATKAGRPAGFPILTPGRRFERRSEAEPPSA